jgi:hypothetical protein
MADKTSVNVPSVLGYPPGCPRHSIKASLKPDLRFKPEFHLGRMVMEAVERADDAFQAGCRMNRPHAILFVHACMPPALTIDDFKLLRAVCEVRYKPAYLIFDRTGQVVHSLQETFTNLSVINAGPNQSSFSSDEGTLALEIGQSRFTASKLDSTLGEFSKHCKAYFDTVADTLATEVYTRIGFRLIFRREFARLEEAEAALNAVSLVNLPNIERFGVAKPPHEVIVRWQNEEIGTVIGFKAETTKIDITLPDEAEAAIQEVHKAIDGVTVDVDHYTVAPVERSQWDPSAWIPQAFRRVKKETEKILTR